MNAVECTPPGGQMTPTFYACAPTGVVKEGDEEIDVCPSANDCSYDRTTIALVPGLTASEAAALTRNNGNPTGTGSSSTATETASAAGGERERGTGGRSH